MLALNQSLKKGGLGLVDAFMMAVAGSAPAYSITASAAVLFAAVGVAGPAVLCIAFLPMLGITIAFAQLNRWLPDAGAAYTWVGRVLILRWGFSLAGLSFVFQQYSKWRRRSRPAKRRLILLRRIRATTLFGSPPLAQSWCWRY
jgi:amino acid transporter